MIGAREPFWKTHSRAQGRVPLGAHTFPVDEEVGVQPSPRTLGYWRCSSLVGGFNSSWLMLLYQEMWLAGRRDGFPLRTWCMRRLAAAAPTQALLSVFRGCVALAG